MGPATELGFRVYYDRINYSAFRKIFRKLGLDEFIICLGKFETTDRHLKAPARYDDQAPAPTCDATTNAAAASKNSYA